jgi:LacI family transcriptional regulator/LacI family repressor for deo operon, udp, cdd, tsx, nupC, and nupG
MITKRERGRDLKRSAPVTMRDVAQAAGVSQGTVSRVLSNSSTTVAISEETRKRVMEAVEALGYHPNLVAQSLRTQRTYMIAVMIADISNPFYHTIVRTVQDIAREHNFDVLIANSDQRYEDEKLFCEAVIRRAVDGIVMVPYHLSTEEIDRVISRTGASIVALGQHIQHPAVDTVFADDERATFEAVSWLIKNKGHRRIGFIGVPDSFPPGPRRWRGFERAMRQAGLSFNPKYVEYGDFTDESGRLAMLRLLEQGDLPSAIFACNDRMALGAMGAALDRNVRVPEDVAIMGFDNIPEGTLIRPHLTTVAQYPEEIGQYLGKALFERIEGRETGPRRVFEVHCEIVERQST